MKIMAGWVFVGTVFWAIRGRGRWWKYALLGPLYGLAWLLGRNSETYGRNR